MSRVAVIPARGGSKRIPRKNIRAFCGRPIIGWPIEAALSSGLFDRVLVSTDDAEIAGVARDCGAEVPFTRPATLADDYTGTTAVIAHTIETLREAGEEPDPVCCLYATAPFVTAADLATGLEKLEIERAAFSFSVTRYAFPVQRALRIRRDGRAEMLHPEYFYERSQDLEEAYHDAGQFYWGRTEAWLSSRPLFDHEAVPVVLPRRRVQDIDSMEDWELAERLFQAEQDNQGS